MLKRIIKNIINLILCLCICISFSNCSKIRIYKKIEYPEETKNEFINKRNLSNIRVALFKNTKSANISSRNEIRIYDMTNKNVILTTKLEEESRALCQRGQLSIGQHNFSISRIRLVPIKQDYFLKINQRRYRGQIEIIQDEGGNSFTLVNFISLEDYLKGVVPNEVLSSWPVELLKAQAICARTFALYKMNGRLDQDYDLDDTVHSQVYRGQDSERDATNAAIEQTRGLVAVFDGKLISAFYHANCGGHTADVGKVWGGDIPYLQGNACGFCASGPHYEWQSELPKAEIAARLRQHNVSVNGLHTLEPLSRDQSGRIEMIRIVHSGGNEDIKAAALRMILGVDIIRSTNFSMQDQGKTMYFKGKGWGHGVGLCQEGGLGMAKSGYSMEEIIAQYYPGVSIRSIR